MDRASTASPGWTVAIVAAVLVAVLLTIDPNNDFVGGADLYHIKHSASFAHAFDWQWSDFRPFAFLAKMLEAAYSILFYIHGPLPPLYIGVIYRVYEALGVTITPALLQLPTAALGVVTVVLASLVLSRARFPTTSVVGAVLVLALSPIFVAAARGTGTYWVSVIPFGQILLLAAMHAFRSGARGGAWMLGLAIAHVILSDMLAFLTVGALLAADAASALAAGARPTPAALAEWAASLRRRPVLVPVLLAAAVPLAGYAIYVVAHDRVSLPLYPILTFWALTAHGGQVGEWVDATGILVRLVLLAGDAWPVLVAGAVLGAVAGWRGESAGRRRLRVFAILNALGYGLLFYVLSADTPASRYYYQIYVLLPVAVLSAFAIEASIRAGRRAFALAAVVLVAAGLSTAMATLIWRVELSPFSRHLVVAENDDPAGDAIGIRRPDYGHRAAGFLVREILLEAWGARPDQHVDIHFASTVAWKYMETFMSYGGLYQRGDWYAARIGVPPKATIHTLARSFGWSPFPCADGARYCIRHLDPASDAATSTPLPDDAPLPACGAQFCVRIELSASGPEFDYWIADGGDSMLYRVTVRAPAPPAVPPGRYQRVDLESRFSEAYPSLWDYFPRRPEVRTRALVGSLLGQ